MTKRKIEKQRYHDIIIDMNEFLVTYASTKLLNVNPNKLAQTVYDAARNDLQNLDNLFNDNGIGRKNKYLDIGRGFINNTLNKNEDSEDVEKESLKLAKKAMQYLGKHPKQFNEWYSN